LVPRDALVPDSGVNITVTVTPDDTHNPYIVGGYTNAGRGWKVTLTNKGSKTPSFSFQVTSSLGSSAPPTAGEILTALKEDIRVSLLDVPRTIKYFGLSDSIQDTYTAQFARRTIMYRAAKAMELGLGPPKPVAKAKAPQREATTTVAPSRPPPPPPPVAETPPPQPPPVAAIDPLLTLDF